ncbi:hypothetical protein [Mycobacterium sp. C31M]
MNAMTRRRPHPASRHTPRPAPVYSQDQLRTRRRAGFATTYDGTFDLAAEVAAICLPLAKRATRLGDPGDLTRGPAKMFGPHVDAMVDAIHGELIAGGVVAWFAEIDALEHLKRTSPQLDSATSRQAVRLLVDMTPRPLAPLVGPADIASGRWATALVELAAPHTAPLADLLARSWRPGAPELRGRLSRSERLCDLLRDVDTAAHEFNLRIERAEANAGNRRDYAPSNHQRRGTTARAELAKLGVPLP